MRANKFAAWFAAAALAVGTGVAADPKTGSDKKADKDATSQSTPTGKAAKSTTDKSASDKSTATKEPATSSAGPAHETGERQRQSDKTSTSVPEMKPMNPLNPDPMRPQTPPTVPPSEASPETPVKPADPTAPTTVKP